MDDLSEKDIKVRLSEHWGGDGPPIRRGSGKGVFAGFCAEKKIKSKQLLNDLGDVTNDQREEKVPLTKKQRKRLYKLIKKIQKEQMEDIGIQIAGTMNAYPNIKKIILSECITSDIGNKHSFHESLLETNITEAQRPHSFFNISLDRSAKGISFIRGLQRIVLEHITDDKELVAHPHMITYTKWGAMIDKRRGQENQEEDEIVDHIKSIKIKGNH